MKQWIFMDLWNGRIYCHVVNWYCLEYSLKNPINLLQRALDLHGWIHILCKKKQQYKSRYKCIGMQLLFFCMARQASVLSVLRQSWLSTESWMVAGSFQLTREKHAKLPPPVCNSAWEATLMCLNIPFEEITLAEFSRCCIVAPLHII